MRNMLGTVGREWEYLELPAAYTDILLLIIIIIVRNFPKTDLMSCFLKDSCLHYNIENDQPFSGFLKSNRLRNYEKLIPSQGESFFEGSPLERHQLLRDSRANRAFSGSLSQRTMLAVV